MQPTYTTQLSAGPSIIDETRILLDLWEEGVSAADLFQRALDSGRFPNMAARRIRNLVIWAFAPRFLDGDPSPAAVLKRLRDRLPGRELEQLQFLYTCRSNPILADFVREVYWSAYTAGRDTVSNKEAARFIVRANQDGKTETSWSDSVVERMAGYLTRACADFGLLEKGIRRERRIVPYRLELRVAAVLAHDLHFAGLGDNRLVSDPDWQLFGLEPVDAVNELKRLALKDLFVVQSAAGTTKISWRYATMEELADVIAEI
jgi:hypothetical protein